MLYQENWTQQAQEQLRRFETRVVEATKVEGYDGKDPQDQDRQWSFSGALLYSVTVITTIGYGNLAPRTPEGKVVTMLYALVGVPLMLLCLSNLGSFLADTFQFAYSHACCRPCRDGRRDAHSKKQQLQQEVQQQQQRVGYSGFGDGSVSLGPPGSIACPPPAAPPPHRAAPNNACGANGAAGPNGPLACGPGCAAAGSFGYYSSVGAAPPDWSQPFRDREREQELHNTVVKTANSRGGRPGQVVTRLQPKHPQHLTPDVHKLLTECVEYQVMHEEPGAAAALRELQNNPPGCLPGCVPGCVPACAAGCPPGCAPGCPAGCPMACHAQHHDAGLAALEEENEDDDDHGGSCGPHSTPSRVPLLCRSSSMPGVDPGAAAQSTPVKRVPPPPPRRYVIPPPPPPTAPPPVAADASDLAERAASPPPPPRVPIYLVLTGLAAYICLGAAVFAAWEEWSFLDGAYFCFVTLSTIGFGDLVPGKSLKSAESQGGQLQVSACVAYLLLGLVLIATAFSLVQEEVLARLSQVARTLGIISKHHQPLHHHHHHGLHHGLHQGRRHSRHHAASQTSASPQPHQPHSRRRSDPT